MTDRELLLATESWPYHPVLPVIKLTDKTGKWPSSGIITAGEVREAGPIRVYHKNIYELVSGLLGPQLENCDYEEFKNADAVLAAWRVD